ncbi:MAG: beta-propeller fold lactonase family protein [Planctomycetes bacterium]|nr:beta-propeller fold lactonase family protein [Planctomycetota bacterium]
MLSLLLATAALASVDGANAGTLIVLNKTDATASFLDASDGTTLAVVGTGIGPHECAVAPGEKLAVVCDYGAQKPGNTLTLLELEHRVAFDKIDLGEYRRPHGIAFASAERLYVTCEQNQALIEVDLTTRKVVRAIATEQQLSHMVALSPDGSRAWVANIGSGSLSALDLATGKLLAKIETGQGSEGLDVTPDGREVWVGNRAGDTLSIVDTQKLAESAEFACGAFPIRIKITPDGKHALVSNAKDGDVSVWDVATRKELAKIAMGVRAGSDVDQRLFNQQFGDGPVPVGILITPDSKRAFVANTNADVITVLDLEKRAIATRFRAGREPDGLGWSSR